MNMVNDDDYDLVSDSLPYQFVQLYKILIFSIHKYIFWYLKQMVISPIPLAFIFFLYQQLYNIHCISPYCYL